MFNLASLSVTLPMLAAGMAGIFVVLGVLIGAVYLLAAVTRPQSTPPGAKAPK